MHIKKIVDQHRRDMRCIYECEHCEHVTEEKSGYDDEHFHNKVIPGMKCDNCGEKASDDYRPFSPLHNADSVV